MAYQKRFDDSDSRVSGITAFRDGLRISRDTATRNLSVLPVIRDTMKGLQMLGIYLRLIVVAWFILPQADVTAQDINRPSEEVKFTFNPADSTSYTTVTTRTRVTEMDVPELEEPATRTVVSEGISKTDIVRQAGGFRITNTMLEMKDSRDGQVVNNPVTQVMAGLAIVYEVDQDGQLLSIEGFPEMIAAIKQALPPKAHQMISQVMNQEVLEKRAMAEWESEVGGFAMTSIPLGVPLPFVEPYEVPGGLGTVTSFGTMEIQERLDYEGHACVRIRYIYDTDPGEFGDLMDKIIDGLGTTASDSIPSFKMQNFQLSGETELIIEPSTLLTFLKASTRNIRGVMQVPDRGEVPMRILDERETLMVLPE